MAVLMGFVLTRMRSWGVELKVVCYHPLPFFSIDHHLGSAVFDVGP